LGHVVSFKNLFVCVWCASFYRLFI